jgi:hypothetical protein
MVYFFIIFFLFLDQQKMSKQSSWLFEHYLPLLTTRDILIVMEIFQFATKYPKQLIFQNRLRRMDAKEFRDSIMDIFNQTLFQQITDCLNIRAIVVQEVNEEMIKRLTSSFYSHNDLLQGYQWLDMSIMIYCATHHTDIFKLNDQTITWNEEHRLHWKLFFAKLLIQFA